MATPSTSRESLGAEPPRRSLMATLTLHTCILLSVVMLPVVIHEVVRTSNLKGVQGLEFSGGATYLLYAIYWIAKIRSFRAKFVLLHLTTVLATAIITVGLFEKSTPTALAALPTIVAVLPVLVIFASWLRRINGIVATCFASIFLALPLGVGSSLLILYGVARSSLGGLRD